MTFPDWAVGVCVSLVGSVTLNIGLNIQKKAYADCAKDPQSSGILKNRTWWLGFALFILGNAGDFIALGFAAQSLITPLGSVSLVSNAFMAHFLLKEPFTRVDLFATISIILGAILAIVFADHSETDYTLDQLLELYVEPGMWIYFILIFSLITLMVYLIIKGNQILQCNQNANESQSLGPILNQAPQHDESNLDTSFTDTASIDPSRKSKWMHILAFSYTAVGALIGSQTVLTAKSSSELLQSTFSGDNQLVYAFTYVIFFFAIATAASQIVLINLALKRFDALYVVPVFYVIWTVFSIIGGSIYFQELDDFSVGQYFAFFTGVILTFFGVYLLSNRQHGEKITTEAPRHEESGSDHRPRSSILPKLQKYEKLQTDANDDHHPE
eukprot:TRINITY_DN4801_c0_g1_i1.p1 TRINITY_DN4801_c0_g1~~TRINITY_DN4801_c0_g1_i1.p1  ORF type:complete len:385 (-),score=69.88 TRINITY_DN4801_c0_g1_i1:208-1362(-)